MIFKRIILDPPIYEPVTLQEACDQLRLNVGDDDALIESIISAARHLCENHCNAYFTEQKIKLVYTELFSTQYIELFQNEVLSVDSVTVTKKGGENITPSFRLNEEKNKIYFDDFTVLSDIERVEVIFNTKPPEDLSSVKAAIKIMITELYENRTKNVIGQSLATNRTFEMLLSAHRNNLGV